MLTDSEKNSLEQIESALDGLNLPQFPVTQTLKVPVEHFTNVWVKNESSQETGTHKDRMAWEIVMAYLSILRAKKNKLNNKPLPRFSIISAGSAALSIQTQLRKYSLPNLKILVDAQTEPHLLEHLQSIGCEIYYADLSVRMLSSHGILALTKNPNGFDITSNRALDPDIRFYDWMAYEILNENPKYVLMPYGTGQLYENVLNIAKTVLTSSQTDLIYKGDREFIPKCNFIGATTNNPLTVAVKLYAPFRPFTQSSPEWVRLFIQQGYCGDKSKIVEVSEDYIREGKRIMDDLGIPSEFSGASAMGLLYQMKNQLPKDAKIIVVNTGQAKFPAPQ